MYQEVNFDGLVGPTHNFAGLSFGNIASSSHANEVSSPKKAALQGLDKMIALARLGLPQGVLPPHERPHMPTLRRLGFQGSFEQILSRLARRHPELLVQMASASPMWVANAGTTSPSCDTGDGKVHFTAANLSSMLHRSIEHEQTTRILKSIFANPEFFEHHQALPSTAFFGDEGAANHTRFSNQKGEQGLAVFVYGQSFFKSGLKPSRFPARQTLEASEAVARQHQLTDKSTWFLQQNPDVIDQGVFHNDVIAVGSRNILLCHEKAFVDQARMLFSIKAAREEQTQERFYILKALEKDVSIEAAVQSYLFNTQIVFTQPEQALIIAPIECRENSQASQFLQSLVAGDNPIKGVEYFDLRQSMKNGGGPACLRFRATLSEKEMQHLSGNTLLTEELYTQLRNWISTHYRDELYPKDLSDPELYKETTQALKELGDLLQLGQGLYEFQ